MRKQLGVVLLSGGRPGDTIVVKSEDGPTYVTFDVQPRRPRPVVFR